ncbi:hypothetical protein J437_LFUL017924 [Ladona fulva]|uniref:Uncharacterized protein n=1 Tax=Ladona fulva TaxID=123851 RepID=A0A8K0P8H6_LADFU|nr:hypothetical protein J437_LFUL017924 [Ladona fulva]
METVLLTAHSEDEACTTISVQNIDDGRMSKKCLVNGEMAATLAKGQHQDVRNKEIAESRQTTEPDKGRESFLLLKGVASDIAVRTSSSLTIETESSDLSESRTQQNSPHTDEMIGDVVTSKTWNCFKAYWNIICRKLFEPNFYFLMTISFWIPALCFFFTNTSSWEETPAMSRNKNKQCIFLNFYDNHDIWHFLSAGGPLNLNRRIQIMPSVAISVDLFEQKPFVLLKKGYFCKEIVEQDG